MNIDQIKKIAVIFLGCAAGSVLIQLAAPMILAALVSAASFAIPFLIYHMVVKKGWRIRVVREETGGDEQETAQGTQNCEAEYEKETNETVKTEPGEYKEQPVKKDRMEAVLSWYSERGKKQLERMILSLYGKGVCECWIRKDGVCSFKTNKGYRRAGIFPSYPGDDSDLVAKLLRDEGLDVQEQGRYLYLVWTEA